MTIDSDIPIRDGTNIGALWTANLLGPVTVLLTQEISYVLVEHAACRGHEFWPVHLGFATGLVLTLLATFIGLRELRRSRVPPVNAIGDLDARARFMSTVGVMVSVVSALVVLAMWSATMFLHPCQ